MIRSNWPRPGYDLHKETAHTADAPSIPQNVRLKLTGNSGQAQLLFDASDRAKGYQVQTAPDPNAGPWTRLVYVTAS